MFELEKIPEKLNAILKYAEVFKESLQNIKTQLMLVFWAWLNFPVALEGALKLKEISYIHAEGYPAAEMKHGPIALVDGNLPVVFVATKDSYHEKIVSNIQEIKARKGKVIAIVSEGDEHSRMADDVFFVPSADEIIAPLFSVFPCNYFPIMLVLQKDVMWISLEIWLNRYS